MFIIYLQAAAVELMDDIRCRIFT